MADAVDVWVTGIGLVSSLGEGAEAHWNALSSAGVTVPRIDVDRYPPYSVHPLADGLNVNRLIPSKADQKQMGLWQRQGVHAAGLALEDAGVLGNEPLLDRTELVVAAGNGERDEALDSRILASLAERSADEAGSALNATLLAGLRPTLYLGELSNLLAGNIQIVLKVTGSSRTLKGEEIAGLSAFEDAARRIETGDATMVLVGGSLNAERHDILLGCELGGNLWQQRFVPVWQRAEAGGGFVLGSAAAFLVLETATHAEARGAKPYARLAGMGANRARREAKGDIQTSLAGVFESIGFAGSRAPFAVLSGASGVEPATSEELAFLRSIGSDRSATGLRAYGTALGHTVEAHFPLGVALACLALHRSGFYPPFESSDIEKPIESVPDSILVTCVGHWRGEGLAIVERVSTAAGGAV